ncbi:urease subunit beta [Clostridium butyricum]|uniref:urease subunit beta n=1 Tax=Clostridium butyricum TaxID=1492 RepID=UPI0002CA3A26|nr:urease subunit beta [Clostridium butyricum]EMU55724.1 urea amidohydrolase [Clostridium butyricum DKU-01]
MIPGEIISAKESIMINKDGKTKNIIVKNIGDRPIQVGSHFHFFEVNKYLKFKREEAYGYRLDIASGTAVRFESGEEKEVSLVEILGYKRIRGLNNLTDAQINATTLEISMEKAQLKNFLND